MPTFSTSDVVLIRVPFTDLSGSKIRPATIVSAPHPSNDVFVVPLTGITQNLQPGEFVLSDWQSAGLRVPTAVKRGLMTVHSSSDS